MACSIAVIESPACTMCNKLHVFNISMNKFRQSIKRN